MDLASLSLISAPPAIGSEEHQIPGCVCLMDSAFCACAQDGEHIFGKLVVCNAIVNFLFQGEVLSNRFAELF